MLVIYAVCMIVGGVLIATTIISGGHDHDFDHDFGHDVGHDIGHDADHDLHLGDHDAGLAHDGQGLGAVHHDADHIHTQDSAAAAWMPFLSFRFWNFFVTFFGMTGLVLTLPHFVENSIVSLVLSLVMGLGCGLAASFAIHKLRVETVGSMPSATDYEGTTGKVIIPFTKEQLGKVRALVHGETIDLQAVTEDDGLLERGDEVLIVRVDKEHAKVTRVAKKITPQ